MTYAELRKTPIRVFWTLNEQIERIRAEEDLRHFQVVNRANAGEDAKEYVDRLRSNLSNVFVVEDVVSNERDETGIQQLKMLAKVM